MRRGAAAQVSRRHGELGQAAASYKQDIEHGTWELKFPAGVHESTGPEIGCCGGENAVYRRPSGARCFP
jgi:hypothetical protein